MSEIPELDPLDALPNYDMVRLRRAFQDAHPPEEHTAAALLSCVHGLLQRHASNPRGIKAASIKEEQLLDTFMVTLNHVNDKQNNIGYIDSSRSDEGYYMHIDRLPKNFEEILRQRLAGLPADYMAERDSQRLDEPARGTPGHDRLAEIFHKGGLNSNTPVNERGGKGKRQG